MKLTKCEHGHFYDADKYPGCPYCDPALQKGSGHIITAGAAGDAAGQAPAAPAAAAPAGPVAGWLVVLDGPARGRDLRLGEGRNFIGVDAAGAPQVLSADAPLSARQAVAVYDPAANAFALLPGSAKELVYLAGKALLTEQPLTAGAVLTVNGAALEFVPYCGGARSWAAPGTKAPAKKAAAKKPAAAKPAPKPAAAAPDAK